MYREKEREVPIRGRYDIIIAGSGPSGMAAAVTAGRAGKRCLLIESQGTVGGMSTSGLMSHWTGRVGGPLYQEILERSAQRNVFTRGRVGCAIDPEQLKILYYEMLEQAGVELSLYTFVCDTILEKEHVVGVVCEGKGGRRAYMAPVVIDATGDGDVAFYAGAEYHTGREEDGKMQPVTLMFKVGGVDEEKAIFPASFESLVETPKGEIQALGRIHLPGDCGHVLLYRSPLPGVVTCNMTNVTGIDGTDTQELTRAELECRRQMRPIVEFLREYAPGFQNCYLISSAGQIGVRETRHFKGLYTVTKQDILDARVFEDAVVRDAWFNFDIHNISGAGLDEHGAQKHFSQKKGYTLPYRCLVPEKIDGLLLSGRNISGTHVAHSNFRAMPICVGIGAACGAAAAIAVETGCELRQVAAADIRKILGLEEII